MKKEIFWYFFGLLLLVGGPGEGRERHLALSLGNPYLGLKYDFSSRLAGELRGIYFEGIRSYLLRGYFSFGRLGILKPYLGLDGGYILFNDEGISGEGYLFSPLLGTEIRLKKNLAISTDFGYSTILVKSGDYSLSGAEIIFNLGLNIYLF